MKLSYPAEEALEARKVAHSQMQSQHIDLNIGVM